jgi:hypothetical protein
LRFGFLVISAQATPRYLIGTRPRPWWISSFVPNLETELGMVLMFASMIPIYGRAVRGNLARLFTFALFLVLAAVTLAWWGFLAWLIWHWAQVARLTKQTPWAN